MINIENVVTPSPEQWEALILGARNPMNSWSKCDSGPVFDDDNDYEIGYSIGEADCNFMMKLRNAGTDHRKFMRMITVYMDITAPLYWWKEFDTYKVGTVANSCSTMHRIHSKEFTLDDFSCEHLGWSDTPEECFEAGDVLDMTIRSLNTNRNLYLETKDKKYWWQMIQMLPSSYNQKRTVMLNYEVLAIMYEARSEHKLDEWVEFCERMKTELLFPNLITGEVLE